MLLTLLICSSKVWLHRHFSNSKIWVIPPQLCQRLVWAGAETLLPQLPMARHHFLVASSTISIRDPQLHHHRETTAIKSEQKCSCLVFTRVEMFPKAMHPLQGMLICRSYSCSPARLSGQAPCYFRFLAADTRPWKRVPFTRVTPCHFLWVWLCFPVSFNTFTLVPILCHFFFQFPCYYSPTDYHSPCMILIMLYLNVSLH